MIRKLVILAALTAPAVLAQAPRPTTSASPVADVRALWETVREYISQSAADMSEAQYAFRPTPEVRTFGELIGHLAGSQNMFCAMVLGEKPPAEDAVEKAAKTKASLIAAWRESNKYCERAYGMSDAALAATTDVFGQTKTKFYALTMNMSHDNEHYGNIITYLRINKIVPPSSRRQ